MTNLVNRKCGIHGDSTSTGRCASCDGTKGTCTHCGMEIVLRRWGRYYEWLHVSGTFPRRQCANQVTSPYVVAERS